MRRLRKSLLRHWPRIAITLVPVLLAALHATHVWRMPILERLDAFIYDTRLHSAASPAADPRIVIVDIDDASLQQIGQWPWSRDRLARLTTELTQRQRAAVVGFDLMFTEADRGAGPAVLQEWLNGPVRADPALDSEIRRLAATLDHDAAFAGALKGQKAVLGFYLAQSDPPRSRGVLPAPVLPAGMLPDDAAYPTGNGFGASIAVLAAAAPAGFLNLLLDDESTDGVVRSVPLIARYEPGPGGAGAAGYYESLSLAVYRVATGAPPPVLRLARAGNGGLAAPAALVMDRAGQAVTVPLDRRVRVLVPYRGPGGAQGGAFRYVSAQAVLEGRLAERELEGKIILVGTTAPGLQDLRTTPMGAAYPGVEIHASVIAGLLDGRFPAMPDDADGYDLLQILVLGGLLAVGLSLLSPLRAMVLALLAAGAIAGLNHWAYRAGLVLPQVAALLMVGLAFAVNMGWGYFIEARTRRGLARIFGTYVPPQLVNQMLRDPGRYTMRAESKLLTVMFCDMRGFTRLSEQMTPAQLQALLNQVFSRLTETISRHHGTVDKYMGDCVMAFWGAPVDMPDHATRAVTAAIGMIQDVHDINQRHRAAGLPAIHVGIGLNTGPMSVGDMGSVHRRSYTVIGDAVNLGARLEGLGEHYGVEIVASEATALSTDIYLWQEIDRVRVKGKQQDVTIFTPRGPRANAPAGLVEELAQWGLVLDAYGARRWHDAQLLLEPLCRQHGHRALYRIYAERLATMRVQPPDTDWDGAIRFERK